MPISCGRRPHFTRLAPRERGMQVSLGRIWPGGGWGANMANVRATATSQAAGSPRIRAPEQPRRVRKASGIATTVGSQKGTSEQPPRGVRETLETTDGVRGELASPQAVPRATSGGARLCRVALLGRREGTVGPTVLDGASVSAARPPRFAVAALPSASPVRNQGWHTLDPHAWRDSNLLQEPLPVRGCMRILVAVLLLGWQVVVPGTRSVCLCLCARGGVCWDLQVPGFDCCKAAAAPPCAREHEESGRAHASGHHSEGYSVDQPCGCRHLELSSAQAGAARNRLTGPELCCQACLPPPLIVLSDSTLRAAAPARPDRLPLVGAAGPLVLRC
jgi:hypothetical protein